MKAENKKIYSVIIVLLVIVVLISLVSFVRANRKIRIFHNDFDMKLPKEVSIILEQFKFGPLGDGEGLVIYQTDSEGIAELIKQDKIENWSKLPIPEETRIRLREKVGLDSEEIKKHMNLDWEKGFYIIIDRFKGERTYNSDYYNFQNFTLGIIDLEKNEIYLYKYNE